MTSKYSLHFGVATVLSTSLPVGKVISQVEWTTTGNVNLNRAVEMCVCVFYMLSSK